MKKVMKIVGIVLLAIIVVAAVAFGLYWHHNTHWFDKYEKALKTAGAEEKQVALPNGNVINYGEVSNEKPALLLIHGQMSIWEDWVDFKAFLIFKGIIFLKRLNCPLVLILL